MARFRNRQSEAQQRSAERRRREDEAPRLLDEVPALKSLCLHIQEHSAHGPIGESKYVRHIPVDHAPALVELPCMDSYCEDGGHDVTREVLRALSSGQTHFEGEDACRGHTKTADCRRVLHYTADATFDG
jgi:hypothetical protein